MATVSAATSALGASAVAAAQAEAYAEAERLYRLLPIRLQRRFRLADSFQRLDVVVEQHANR
jgi:hypothetical protein